ncbi:ABC transporter ATP-binding protein [Clostridium frigidicarnis]|uniref:Iron complex transport system ATP-binding protein n=1 Tax=Clostridium frigidicarnis TaxID=84698 RepID=A0A1I0W6U0_9CLOT|nr:ABC transporter ATP-binding protein [Clostridium frigidicarnis]SFA84291.1 iron complex transport system ATP-binding protein [Clostridium frigidicarnis]
MKLEVKDLCVEISSKKIVQDVSLNLKKGEFVGIVGPNGSGKSTILKSIYRAIKPKKGSIFINNVDISKISIKSTAKELAVVSQFNENNFDFKVEDMVMMGRAPHKSTFEFDTSKDYEIVYECLKKVSMESYGDRNFSTLSGGEKQRVVLARALAQDVDFLILDEPTNHLDIKYQIQILDLVKSLNISVISALHDLNLAAAYCDKIYMVNSGEIVSSGISKDVLTEDNIKHVFEVDCEVSIHPKTNRLNIVYFSGGI